MFNIIMISKWDMDISNLSISIKGITTTLSLSAHNYYGNNHAVIVRITRSHAYKVTV